MYVLILCQGIDKIQNNTSLFADRNTVTEQCQRTVYTSEVYSSRTVFTHSQVSHIVCMF